MSRISAACPECGADRIWRVTFALVMVAILVMTVIGDLLDARRLNHALTPNDSGAVEMRLLDEEGV